MSSQERTASTNTPEKPASADLVKIAKRLAENPGFAIIAEIFDGIKETEKLSDEIDRKRDNGILTAVEHQAQVDECYEKVDEADDRLGEVGDDLVEEYGSLISRREAILSNT